MAATDRTIYRRKKCSYTTKELIESYTPGIRLHQFWKLRNYIGGKLAILTGRSHPYSYHHTERFLVSSFSLVSWYALLLLELDNLWLYLSVELQVENKSACVARTDLLLIEAATLVLAKRQTSR